MSPPPEPKPAVRLVFEYDARGVRLVAEQPVEMVLPDADADTQLAREAGYYVDARDATDATLARVRAEGAFASSMEIFPEDPASAITRVDVAPRGAFTVVVPAPEGADHVTVLRVPEPAPGIIPEGVEDFERRRGIDLASFPLTRQR